MNAYELAEQLKHWSGNRDELWNAANMLRQQADRIAELEKQLYFKDYYEELPETPVGFLNRGERVARQIPPQTKPLSDEEIIKIFNQIWVAGGNTNGVMHRFARAIEAKVRGEK